ncbi:MAG TPA: T9SS type A sorting domain-containing protein [Bacteroidales bacterium]|nr:T9SS type A sorting domain-containing protein [Bacteroidales bacterium]HOH83071.1 T9SS type A sorting domain-containing protein [Bacteroidales bacterium]HQN15487.1 T9SS type A sorting domain-containing protein [Bacteroidales bacterium]
MKKLFTVLFFVIFCLNANAQTLTSVADGNWNNPLTWGGNLPIPGSTIIINHHIVLNTDYGFTSGSITINSGGSLTGDSGLRGLSMNYPSGSGFLTINGAMDVARVSFFDDTVTVEGSFDADSLYNKAVIDVGLSGTINASQFFNGFTGNINNSGSIHAINLLNLGSIVNAGVINAADFDNCKSLTNNAGAMIALSHNFLNADSISGPAIFTNNGRQEVMNDWQNKDTVYGAGKFCIVNNTSNSGLMSGTFDFCDMSGGDVDFNTGDIDTTITYCAFPCTPGTAEFAGDYLIEIFPNPAGEIFYVSSEKEISSIEVFNLLGETVYSATVNARKFKVCMPLISNGIYLYRLSDKDNSTKTGKIIIEK